jgi:hypothetical protein
MHALRALAYYIHTLLVNQVRCQGLQVATSDDPSSTRVRIRVEDGGQSALMRLGRLEVTRQGTCRAPKALQSPWIDGSQVYGNDDAFLQVCACITR